MLSLPIVDVWRRPCAKASRSHQLSREKKNIHKFCLLIRCLFQFASSLLVVIVDIAVVSCAESFDPVADLWSVRAVF
jgi:hypothetical protein